MLKAWRIDPDGIKVVSGPLERLPRDREDRLATRVQDLRQSHSSALWPPGHPWTVGARTLNAPGPGLQEKSPGPLHPSVSCHPYFYPLKKKKKRICLLNHKKYTCKLILLYYVSKDEAV